MLEGVNKDSLIGLWSYTEERCLVSKQILFLDNGLGFFTWQSIDDNRYIESFSWKIKDGYLNVQTKGLYYLSFGDFLYGFPHKKSVLIDREIKVKLTGSEKTSDQNIQRSKEFPLKLHAICTGNFKYEKKSIANAVLNRLYEEGII
ncbi:hypothetical protein [Bacillus sp. FJAT-45350]|uniref:hypothetical protein n=1 Tax=Bacillus sp. FJAT-45350 TaxID=2011014 RepID=UPI000BB9854E|nr:hypothetical protein [Bacillus sp. FJAT-45350]